MEEDSNEENEKELLQYQRLKEREMDEERKLRYTEKIKILSTQVEDWRNKYNLEDRKNKSMIRKMTQDRINHQKELMSIENKYKNDYREKQLEMEKIWTEDLKDYKQKLLDQEKIIYGSK